MQPVHVVGVRVELPANQPVVLLKETEGTRYLPIWIGAVEASAIAFHQQGVQSARPLTHDLLRDVVSALRASLSEVRITELRDDTFFAELVFADGTSVSARPSDAIALALRTESAIFADDTVLASAGIVIDENDSEDGETTGALGETGPASEREVEEFREFLDTISPEDFAGGTDTEPGR
ncbi:MAG: bifunctional nuclease family protein [bacterium]